MSSRRSRGKMASAKARLDLALRVMAEDADGAGTGCGSVHEAPVAGCDRPERKETGAHEIEFFHRPPVAGIQRVARIFTERRVFPHARRRGVAQRQGGTWREQP